MLVTSRSSRTTDELLNGVRVIKAARLATVASTPLSVRLPWELRRLRPDVMHLHFPYPVAEVSAYLFGRARATVVTYHSDVVRQRAILRLYGPLMRRALGSVDRIIATTPRYLESSEMLRLYRGKVRVIPFGIDRARFLNAPPDSASTLRGRYGGGPILLFVGVLRYYKGLNYLLEAMPSIPAQLLVIGDGPMREEWEALAHSLGLAERVTFLGRVSDDDLPAYYHASDVFVLPACERSEAFGLVQIEAMSAGLPVVCTELGTGTSYVNRDGESGLVVEPRNPVALAEAISRLLADSALRERLSEGARARSELFDAARMVDEIEALYTALVPPAPSPLHFRKGSCKIGLYSEPLGRGEDEEQDRAVL